MGAVFRGRWCTDLRQSVRHGLRTSRSTTRGCRSSGITTTRSIRRAVEGADIDLFEAWKTTAGDPAVIVAIMDGGVQWDHPDLAANMWVNEAELNGVPGVDDDGNGYRDDIHGYDSTRSRPMWSPVSTVPMWPVPSLP